MHETNTKQHTARQTSRSNLAGASNPSERRDEFSAFRSRLLLKRFLRARRIMMSAKRTLTAMIIGLMVLAAGSTRPLAVQQADADQAVQSAQQTPTELQQLVAPFALYPDALVAQVLAASTYPTQIVEAERWLQAHSNLKADELASEVDKESWDPSVKALTQFPSVLARMDQNLTWTSAVGDAYFNQQQDVLDAVQVMRQRAEEAGTLQTTPQETVATQGSTIVIQPSDPDVCYLPIYDPWTVYGAPLAVYPGFILDPWVGPEFFFGPPIGLRFFRGFRWGWPAWGFNWGRREVIFNHNVYISRSPSFFHRFPGARGDFRPGTRESLPRGDQRFEAPNRSRVDAFPDRNSGRQRNDIRDRNSDRSGSGALPAPNNDQNHRANRGFDRPAPGTRSGAFSGIGQGGIERGSASRGQSSFGRGGFGGGGMRGSGGGMRGGGGGGRHR